MADKINTDGTITTKDKIMALEQRYIELLQSKISNLEQQSPVNNASMVPSNQQIENPYQYPPSVSVPSENIEEPRYPIVISKWDPDSGDFKVVDATKKEEKEVGPQNQSHKAFTFRKIIMTRTRYREQEVTTSEVDIEFKPLQQLLGKITSKWGWAELVVSCRSPYTALVHSWQEAVAESEKVVELETDDDKQARTDLTELLRMISTSSGYLPLDQYFKERKTMLEEGTITHDALWTLFPPGTLILAQPFLDQPQVFSVQSSDHFVSQGVTFDLVCYSFDWDGYEFNRVPFELKIPYWGPDRRSVIELPCYPLHYYGDPRGEHTTTQQDAINTLKTKLIDRGKTFHQICTAPKGKQIFKYHGDAQIQSGRSLLQGVDSSFGSASHRSDNMSSSGSSLPRPGVDNRFVYRRYYYGRFSVVLRISAPDTAILGDLQKYKGQLESLSPERRANPVFQEIYKFHWDKRSPETDEQYLMCPPRVLGYTLKLKQWAQLLVDHLDAPDGADASTFNDNLQLDYEDTDEKGGYPLALQDFALDKGKGLVIMLYGFPGVGKTLTAESVALMAGKPLLSIGVSDIGIKGDKVEANLQKVFDLAARWEAVLLFDEADVFLEARGEGENDLRRNAMVSVLLRILEYYDGILILTTNRMRSFDIAVQSRIHIAVKYEELSQEQQESIFRAFIDQLKEKKLVENYADLMEWVKKESKRLHFNGRQIRNVVSTALGIALMEEGRLKREHLIKVAEQTKNFKLDLKSQEELYRHITR
ncbi:hypothetical protein BDV95DRAFT_604950 [Massariosphaeria phaeospora]|uniref:AAA+ ATPase domain-containing protein n=1 Tax=Massariosphaeria phaeospora TaxID=100035 RepID=A0A7C8MEL5_9PLEO|nr:hypothetical protein BDV95DRAFT_604950 [Massariosphaeria phaeospora]